MTPLTPEKQKIVESLLPLARRMARWYALEDALSIAYEAVCRTVANDDPTKQYITPLRNRCISAIRMAMVDEKGISHLWTKWEERASSWCYNNLPDDMPIEERIAAVRNHFPQLSYQRAHWVVFADNGVAEHLAWCSSQQAPSRDPLPQENEYLANLSLDTSRKIEQIKERVQLLKPKLRTAVEMYHFEGKTMREIAAVEGVSCQAIECRLKHALEKLTNS